MFKPVRLAVLFPASLVLSLAQTTAQPLTQQERDTVLLSGHAARHTAQIEEVKTSPGYPK